MGRIPAECGISREAPSGLQGHPELSSIRPMVSPEHTLDFLLSLKRTNAAHAPRCITRPGSTGAISIPVLILRSSSKAATASSVSRVMCS